MEADFSGYATKAGLKCSDGRTIMPEAFKSMDGLKVPLVWQHGHGDSGNVLGHALLEVRDDGVYTYAFFNETSSGKNAKALVQHGDITALSIYANQLIERSKQVFHGVIREVSLVLSGANPGAFIDNVTIAHSDGDIDTLDDEAIIYTGLEIEHAFKPFTKADAPSTKSDAKPADKPADKPASDPTVQEIYDTLTKEQKDVVNYMIGAALETAAEDKTAAHSDESGTEDGSTEDSSTEDSVTEDSTTEDSTTEEEGDITHKEGTDSMTHKEGDADMSRNVFEQNGITTQERPTLTHSQLQEIVADAQKNGSFKEAFLSHVATYGIENIDFLFPDAQSVQTNPDVIGRRQEWVASLIGGAKHSPFSRIKSTAVDLTADEARAKGYVKATLKKEEVIRLLKRVTTPTTIYKKQKLDRDDIVDITDLDVVAWLKAEMRVMLDEELARAILIGDGRQPDAEDKIDELAIRPIAFDDEMYAHQVTVASDIGGEAIVESILRARTYYKGTGTPTLYTTDSILTDLILLKDKVGRRLYTTETELAAGLRVQNIVVVEVMEDVPDLLAVIVNISDYTLGADKGGAISMFDDFDIDYNQYKYLIETRVSGALTKPKSAVVVKRTSGSTAVPVVPTYNAGTHTITIPTTAGVLYQVDGVTKAGGALVITETTDVEAVPAPTYSFAHNIDTMWTYVYTV